MSTHNIGFYEEISKIITYHQISSNRHLIYSADYFSNSEPGQSLGGLKTGDFENLACPMTPEPGSNSQ